jgi:hypothetical protein
VSRARSGFGSILLSSLWALSAGAGCGSDAAEPNAGGGGSEGMSPAAPALEIPALGWTSAPPAEDPFVEFEAGRLRCSPFSFRMEANWLEVTTTDCNYATLVYRFSREVLAGDVVRGEVAWATLASIEPAIGTLAFATARDGVLWTHEVSIPGEADIVKVEFTIGQAATAGSALYFHVRNHGYNAWQLSPLTLTDPS